MKYMIPFFTFIATYAATYAAQTAMNDYFHGYEGTFFFLGILIGMLGMFLAARHALK